MNTFNKGVWQTFLVSYGDSLAKSVPTPSTGDIGHTANGSHRESISRCLLCFGSGWPVGMGSQQLSSCLLSEQLPQCKLYSLWDQMEVRVPLQPLAMSVSFFQASLCSLLPKICLRVLCLFITYAKAHFSLFIWLSNMGQRNDTMKAVG